MIIRQEKARDYAAVHQVVEAAFRNVSESDGSEPALVDSLRQCDAFVPELSLVAEADDVIVGHILLTEIIIADGNETHTSLAMAPLSVLPEYQKRGIGSLLIKEAHKRAAGLGYDSVAVLGHSGYYPKFGYLPASRYGIRFPFDAPDECCMILELRKGALDGVPGMIIYPAPFME